MSFIRQNTKIDEVLFEIFYEKQGLHAQFYQLSKILDNILT